MNKKKIVAVELDTQEKKMLQELKEFGYKYRNSNSIFRSKNIEVEEANIILKYLPLIYKESLGCGEILVRSLLSVAHEFDPKILIDLYSNSELNPTIKWTIAYVISKAKTSDIELWLRDQLLATPTFQSSAFLWAVDKKIRFNDAESLRSFLKKLFNSYCSSDVYQKLLKKHLLADDSEFVLQKSEMLPIKLRNVYSKIANILRNKK